MSPGKTGALPVLGQSSLWRILPPNTERDFIMHKQSQTSKSLWLSPGIYSLAKVGQLFEAVKLCSSTSEGHSSRSCSAASPSHSCL